MLHMTFHTVAKSLLFLCAGNVYQHYKTDLFHKIKGGVIRAMPVTGAVFLMATLAIVGMPPFSLFQSEFLIVQRRVRRRPLPGHACCSSCSAPGSSPARCCTSAGLVLGPAGQEAAAAGYIPGAISPCWRWRRSWLSSASGCPARCWS